MKCIKNFLLILILLFGFNTALANNQRETLILFDSSGSMVDPFEGKTKIEHAADAVFNILQQMPNDEKIGLRTIGVHPSQIMNLLNAGRKEICQQTLLHNPIRSYNEEHIIGSLKELYPFGPSPLAYALRTVVENDFQHYTPEKHIILITDGYETCDGNPCEYIKYLMTQRDDIIIDVVAIGANKYDLSYLQCLTDSTGGKIYDVQRPMDIVPVVKQLTNQISPQQPTAKPQQQSTINNFAQQPIKLGPQKKILYKNYLLEFYD